MVNGMFHNILSPGVARFTLLSGTRCGAAAVAVAAAAADASATK